MSLYHIGAMQETWTELHDKALGAAKAATGPEAVSWVNYDNTTGSTSFATKEQSADAYGKLTDRPLGRKAILLYSSDTASYPDNVRDYAVYQPSEGTRQSPIAWLVAGGAAIAAILGIAASGKGKH